MIAFLATKLIGLGVGEKFARPLVWAALLALALTLGKCAWDRHERGLIERGQLEAVNAGNETTLTQIGEANDAANEIRNDAGAARYCECLRSATPATAGNCERYRPDEPVPGRSSDPGRLCSR